LTKVVLYRIRSKWVPKAMLFASISVTHSIQV
jgi:hypothetical protein